MIFWTSGSIERGEADLSTPKNEVSGGHQSPGGVIYLFKDEVREDLIVGETSRMLKSKRKTGSRVEQFPETKLEKKMVLAFFPMLGGVG